MGLHWFILVCVVLCVLRLTRTLAADERDWESVLIRDVPHILQKPDFCGEACVAMYLQKLGHRVDQDFVFDQAGLSPAEGRGCYTKELAVAARRIGFDTGPVWSQVEADDSDALSREFANLHRDLRNGVPSIVCMRYDQRPDTTEHFRLVLGYDAKRDEVVYHEPAVPQAAWQRMSRHDFLQLWPLKYKSTAWTMVRLRLEPNELQVRPAAGFTDADYAQHIMRLKERLPSKEFHIVLQKPFVVVGNESLEVVRKRSVKTIKWSADRLKRDYFHKDPNDIIDIWLFKDKASYEKYTWELFRDRPGTPFGYYSPTHRVLVMNISTGGGTLVHEIVHPFIASNFPTCPAWFNEGLASLYEQCGDNDGHIWGYTNWRLRGLQGAIGDDRVPSFKTLCSTTTREFYNEDPGTNYAQARYLCYYLQEHGKLVKYYHAFRKNAEKDPSGFQTLVAVLGDPDMDEFKKDWEAYVAKLRFP